MEALVPILDFLYIFLTISVLVLGTGNGSWQQRDGRQDTIIFRVPIGRRVGLAMFIPILFVGLPLIDQGVEHTIGVVLDCVGAFGFLYLAGPNELHIDLRRRTYRRVMGLPPLVTTGSLDSLGGVCVMTYGAAQYWVVMKKAPGDDRGFLLGMFSNRVKAQAMVQEINTRLQLRPT